MGDTLFPPTAREAALSDVLRIAERIASERCRASREACECDGDGRGEPCDNCPWVQLCLTRDAIREAARDG